MRKLVVLAFVALGFGNLYAQNAPLPPAKQEQGQHPRRGHHHHDPAIRAARQEFFNTKALPVMKAQHKILWDKMSAEDRKFVESKRAEHKQMREKMRSLRQEMHKAHKNGASPEVVHQQFDSQLKAQHDAHEAFYASFEPLLERNKNDFEPIRAELKKVHDSWREERKDLRQNAAPDKQGEKTDKGHHHHHHKGHHHKGHRHADKAARHEHRFVDFILWDGESNPMENQNNPEQRRAAAAAANPLKMNTFPNPAQGQTTLNLELPKAAKNVTLRILDTQGKTVFTQNFKDLPEGQQQIPLDISQLAAGTYFYSIIADDQTAAATMIVK